MSVNLDSRLDSKVVEGIKNKGKLEKICWRVVVKTYWELKLQNYNTLSKEIFDTFLTNKKTHKNVFIEKTATPQNMIVPNWTPFEAIDFCAARSTSAAIEESSQDNPDENQLPNAPGSLFVFYEKLGTCLLYTSDAADE